MRAALMEPTHAGGVVYRGPAVCPEYLLVRARTSGDMWVFPKGHIEPGESVGEAAVREVREEAGVEALVVAPLGTFTLPRGLAQMYLMRYERPAPAPAERECAWLELDEALRTVAFPESRALLERAHEVLRSRT
jgi:diadenosine hexaphosphate hydrolase (ATP-forming)